MTQIDGSTTLTMTDFGTTGYMTLEPNNSTQEESIVFTGVTQNANGTATLTGVSTVLTVAPYTQTSGLAKSHPGGAKAIVTNTAAFYDRLASLDDDETVSGVWTFPDDPSRPRIAADTDTVTATAFVTLGQLSRQAISGASNASTTVKGIVQLPRQSDVDNRSTAGSSGALIALTPDKQRTVLTTDYVVDTGTKSAYAIAPTPAVTQYVAGMVFTFKATNANTAGATLNVNSLGVKTLTRGKASLRAEDIRTNYIVSVINTGTTFEVLSASGQVPVSQDGQEIYSTSTAGTTAYTVALVPTVSKYTAGMVVRFKPDTGGGHATLNVNSLGAKNIFRYRNGTSAAVVTGDIVANQQAEVIYNGTQFELQTPTSTAPVWKTGVALYAGNTSSGGQTIAHGLTRAPLFAQFTAMDTAATNAGSSFSYGSYDGTNMSCISTSAIVASTTVGATDKSINVFSAGTTNGQSATVTLDATNINLTWTKGGSGATGNIQIMWSVFG